MKSLLKQKMKWILTIEKVMMKYEQLRVKHEEAKILNGNQVKKQNGSDLLGVPELT